MGATFSTGEVETVEYADFVPTHKSVREEGIDTLVIELPEFKKEQISVQFEKFENLSISGERPLEDNRWSRFRKHFQLEGCNEIRSKFENGRLSVKMFPGAKLIAIKIKETTVLTPKPSTGKDEGKGARKDAEKAGEKGKDQTEEKKGKEKLGVLQSGLGLSKPMQLLLNVIVAVVILVVMALYVTSKN